MKQVFLFSIMILCISCFSCNKEEQDHKRYFVGDWDWVSSTSGQNGGTSSPLITYSPQTTGNNYGVRIKKNGNAFLYENGKQLKKGKLEKTEEIPYSTYSGGKTSTDYLIQATLSFGDETLIFTGGSLTCKTWPYSNSSNTFKKKTK